MVGDLEVQWIMTGATKNKFELSYHDLSFYNIIFPIKIDDCFRSYSRETQLRYLVGSLGTSKIHHFSIGIWPFAKTKLMRFNHELKQKPSQLGAMD